MLRTKQFELVELVVPAGQPLRVPFQDIQQLRSQQGMRTVIKAIEAFSNQGVTVSPTGNTMIAVADFKKAYLVLNQGGREWVNKIPLTVLNRLNPDITTAANYVPSQDLPFELDDLKDVDWTKSYVLFGSIPTNAQFSILFGVHYVYTDK